MWLNCQFRILEFVFLVGKLSVSYFQICVSCGPAVSFLFWSSCFLWAKCQFLILKFVFIVGELSVSYFEICVFLWANCHFLILKFVFSCGRTVSFLFCGFYFLWAKCPFLILEFPPPLIGERNQPVKIHARAWSRPAVCV